MQSRIVIDITSDKLVTEEDINALLAYIKNGCALFHTVSGTSNLEGAKLVFSTEIGSDQR